MLYDDVKAKVSEYEDLVGPLEKEELSTLLNKLNTEDAVDSIKPIRDRLKPLWDVETPDPETILKAGDPYCFYAELALFDEIDNEAMVDYQIEQIHAPDKRQAIADAVEEKFIDLIKRHKRLREDSTEKEVARQILSEQFDDLDDIAK